jgi:hypothetical protein
MYVDFCNVDIIDLIWLRLYMKPMQGISDAYVYFFAVCGGTQFLEHRSAIDSSIVINNYLLIVPRDYQVTMSMNFQVTDCRNIDKKNIF